MPNAPHKSINNAFRCALIALAAACPLLAHAQNQWLNTTGDNLYSNPANWSLNTVPLTGDILFESTPGPLTLDTSPTIAIANINTDIFLNMAANPLNANYLKIASTPSSTGSLTINEADNVYLSNSSYITFGRDATGALTVTGPNTAIQLGRLSFNGYETDHLGRAVRVPGHGTLTVNNGATITITKPDSPSLHMITDFGSTHRANLDGPNSSIQIIEEGQIILGNDDPQNTPNGSAILNIQNGASLLAPLSDTLLLTGGTINLINGTLQTAEFNNSGGTFNWTAGTLHITQSPVTLAPDQPLGNSLTIDATKTLDVRGLQPQENTLRIGNIDNSPTHLNITAGGSVYANTAELIDNANITLSGDNALLHVDFLSFESPDDPAHTQRLLIENGATVDSEAIRVFAGDITIGPGGTINAIRKTLTPNTTYGTGFEFYDRYSSIPKSLTLSGGTLNAESFTLETGVVNIQSGEMNIAHPDENSNTDQLGINLRTEAQFNFSGGHITTDFFNMGVPATPYLPPYLNWTGGELTIQSRTIFQYDESNSLVSSLYGSLSMGSGMHLNVEKELLVRYGSNFGNPNNPVMRFDILDGATVQANAMLIGDPLDATSLISTRKSVV